MEVLDRLVKHRSKGEAALLAGDLNLREDEASKPKTASALGYTSLTFCSTHLLSLHVALQHKRSKIKYCNTNE
jgi:hypothetical protein